MKFSYQNIHSLFKINRLIVLSVVIMAFASSGFSGWMAYHIHKESLQNAFAIDNNGNVQPLLWEDKTYRLDVEALSHLERFHELFYGLDAAILEEHLEKVLWWGDSSVDELYKQKKSEGFYNRLLQYSLIQKVIEVDSKIELQGDVIPFSTRTRFEVRRGEITDTYELITTGKLVQVERNFPHNPHGLLVTEFFEKSLKKLNDEN